jgi:uncharacterized membrane protein YdjX (TVP38/TMEM64 family)
MFSEWTGRNLASALTYQLIRVAQHAFVKEVTRGQESINMMARGISRDLWSHD